MISIPPRSTRTYILFPYKTPCRSTRMFGVLAKRLFGSANDRFLKGLNSTVAATNALEPELQELSDEVLRARPAELRGRLDAGVSLDDILPVDFATGSEAAKRTLGPRQYDVQPVGGTRTSERL